MKIKSPKIVYWDLETSPDPRNVYRILPSIGSWPGRSFKAELHKVISFGYRIEGEKKAKIINAWDFKSYRDKRGLIDDTEVVKAGYNILKDADLIVTHNGKSFDVKVMQTRLAGMGLAPLPPLKHFDTKVVAKNKLSLYSNSLSEVAKYLKCTDKMSFSNKWSLWERIAFNEETTQDRKLMSKYCIQDVDTLREVYHKLKPFAPNQSVSYQLFSEDTVCSNCGGKHLISNGQIVRKRGVVQRLLCKSCGTSLTIDAKNKTTGAI